MTEQKAEQKARWMTRYLDLRAECWSCNEQYRPEGIREGFMAHEKCGDVPHVIEAWLQEGYKIIIPTWVPELIEEADQIIGYKFDVEDNSQEYTTWDKVYQFKGSKVTIYDRVEKSESEGSGNVGGEGSSKIWTPQLKANLMAVGLVAVCIWGTIWGIFQIL